jgi:hypothetical protein
MMQKTKVKAAPKKPISPLNTGPDIHETLTLLIMLAFFDPISQ